MFLFVLSTLMRNFAPKSAHALGDFYFWRLITSPTMEYNFREIEKKWQQKWVEEKTYKVVEDKSKPKIYVLNMCP